MILEWGGVVAVGLRDAGIFVFLRGVECRVFFVQSGV